jgi:CRP/FNR family transcriptional regulator
MVGYPPDVIARRESAFASKQLVHAEAQGGLSTRRTNFPAKSTIFTESEPSIEVYMLTRGTACLYKTLADGRRQIVGFALAGELLGSPLLERYTFSVDAISEVTVRQSSRKPFLASLQANPESLFLMLEAALQENCVSRNHMLLLGRGTAEEKFVEFIIGWRAKVRRHGVPTNLVPLPMSRRDIADLGLTIETVSRVIKKLERENVIRVSREGLQLMGSTERPLLFERNCKIT